MPSIDSSLILKQFEHWAETQRSAQYDEEGWIVFDRCITSDEELWLINNNIIDYEALNHTGEIWFQYEDEAMAFKMRWK